MPRFHFSWHAAIVLLCITSHPTSGVADSGLVVVVPGIIDGFESDAITLQFRGPAVVTTHTEAQICGDLSLIEEDSHVRLWNPGRAISSAPPTLWPANGNCLPVSGLRFLSTGIWELRLNEGTDLELRFAFGVRQMSAL